MTKSIKLGQKQLGILNSIQAQKKQVDEAFKNLNDKELILLESVFENAGITEQPTNIKLEGDTLVLEFKEKEVKTRAKRTKKEVEEVTE